MNLISSTLENKKETILNGHKGLHWWSSGGLGSIPSRVTRSRMHAATESACCNEDPALLQLRPSAAKNK